MIFARVTRGSLILAFISRSINDETFVAHDGVPSAWRGAANAEWRMRKIDRMSITPAGALMIFVQADAHWCDRHQIVVSEPNARGL